MPLELLDGRQGIGHGYGVVMRHRRGERGRENLRERVEAVARVPGRGQVPRIVIAPVHAEEVARGRPAENVVALLVERDGEPRGGQFPGGGRPEDATADDADGNARRRRRTHATTL